MDVHHDVVDDDWKDDGIASDAEGKQPMDGVDAAVDAAELAAKAKRREYKRKQLDHLKQV
jgi:hypothetical protein